ncbi:MAG: hypothetical protein HY473_00925 [Candidatus Sungbacteria bacterium]|uniref:Lipoprotein n=1 Tax=Candidatus Sungiibacteriota bacterium TaxID=2750080 RepID=A0A932YZ55_9BACT|nr:hypothetical protein [Candidatus Sungbacteria bacterium]
MTSARTIALFLIAILAVGCAPIPRFLTIDSAIPASLHDPEAWAQYCPAREFYGLNVHVCRNPNGSASNFLVAVYNGEPKLKNFVGRAWEINYQGGVNIDYRRIRTLLRTDAGEDFPGAVGALPHFTHCYNADGYEIGLSITIRGENGKTGIRTLVFDWVTLDRTIAACRPDTARQSSLGMHRVAS